MQPLSSVSRPSPSQAYADAWSASNPQSSLSADTAYVLAFSMIMLNTDLHNPQIANKMSREQFISNNRGIGPNGTDVDRSILDGIYDSILAQVIMPPSRRRLHVF